MRAVNNNVLVLLLASLAGCGQQLVEFADPNFPAVSATDPASSATGVGVSRTVNATFSVQMDPATINATTFTLKQGTTSVPGAVTYAGTTARFVPTSLLAPNTVYDATITTGAKAMTGASIAADYKWSFTTAAASGPSVVVTDPLNNATRVPVNKVIGATFDKAMNGTTINGTTFTVKQGTNPPIGGTVAYAGNTATFTPTNPLAGGTTYSATVTTGAKDTGGTALAADFVWTFTTEVPLAINLRGIATFGIASRDGLTSTGVTVVNGDVALYLNPVCTDATGGPGSSSQTCSTKTYATSTGLTVNGSIYYFGDPFDNGGTANSVTNDLQIAWNEGKNKVDTNGTVAGDQMDLKTFVPGVYHNANLGLATGGTATLDAQNDAKAVFIFKVDTDFADTGTLGNPSKIVLTNGAQARNVWFVVGRDAVLGSGTSWNGNILAGRTVTVKSGTTSQGRILAGASGTGAFSLTGAASPSVTTVSVPQ